MIGYFMPKTRPARDSGQGVQGSACLPLPSKIRPTLRQPAENRLTLGAGSALPLNDFVEGAQAAAAESGVALDTAQADTGRCDIRIVIDGLAHEIHIIGKGEMAASTGLGALGSRPHPWEIVLEKVLMMTTPARMKPMPISAGTSSTCLCTSQPSTEMRTMPTPDHTA